MTLEPSPGNSLPSMNESPKKTIPQSRAVQLTRELEKAKAKIQALEQELEDIDQGLRDSRHKVRLRKLSHLHGRLLNSVQWLCPEDQLRINRLLEE